MKTVFINASPKKKLSVSSFLISLVKFFVKGNIVKVNINHGGRHDKVLEELRDASSVVFAIPLYVDSVPSHMLKFLKKMEDFCKENNLKLNVYTISNGGFIEGVQNKPLLQLIKNFCTRSNLCFCGGLGVGGGVMLNVLRILLFVYSGLFILNSVLSAVETGILLNTDLLYSFALQIGIIVLLSCGVLYNCFRMSRCINKNEDFSIKFTRILLPSFVFIIITDIFFTIISIFSGGFFRGWFSKK